MIKVDLGVLEYFRTWEIWDKYGKWRKEKQEPFPVNLSLFISSLLHREEKQHVLQIIKSDYGDS